MISVGKQRQRCLGKPSCELARVHPGAPAPDCFRAATVGWTRQGSSSPRTDIAKRVPACLRARTSAHDNRLVACLISKIRRPLRVYKELSGGSRRTFGGSETRRPERRKRDRHRERKKQGGGSLDSATGSAIAQELSPAIA